jgi:uncharacterized protein
MILPDANLILYAYDLESPFHTVAAAWWTKCLSEAEAVGLTHVILFAFLRLSTSPRVFTNPFPIKDAIKEVRAWSEQPNTRRWQPTCIYEQVPGVAILCSNKVRITRTRTLHAQR